MNSMSDCMALCHFLESGSIIASAYVAGSSLSNNNNSHGFSSLLNIAHLCIKEITRYMPTSGEVTTILLNTKSFLIIHRLQPIQLKRNTVKALVLMAEPMGEINK